ncbi:MAG: hypothetical protein GC185_05930 [Alphaproteobacteria bacterium]|nr:hypothetical protein [Alphaproteobacteria bacterium]
MENEQDAAPAEGKAWWQVFGWRMYGLCVLVLVSAVFAAGPESNAGALLIGAVLLFVPFGIVYQLLVMLRRTRAGAVLMPETPAEAMKRGDADGFVRALMRRGYIIERHEGKFVTARKPKAGFSFILFLILMACWAVPGILYLIWYATRRDRVEQFVMPESAD